jgi:hypothetical protein
MSRISKHIKINGRLYRRVAFTPAIAKEALSRLYAAWLAENSGLLKKEFGNLDISQLANLLSDKFSVFVGDLAADLLPWEDYAKDLKGDKED